MLEIWKLNVCNGEVQCYEYGSEMLGMGKWNVRNMEVKC